MGVLLRVVLVLLLAMLLFRALGKLLAGLIAGAGPEQGRHAGPPERGVQMVRDPVCGTFLPAETAVNLHERGGAVRYFCSEKCRDAYKARA
jgi:YHS domain-containing protein